MPVALPAQAAEDIGPHAHVGKERIVLKQIAHPARLGRQIDAALRIKEGHAVQHNSAPVRLLNAGDAFERHALAAAGSPQQAGDASVRFKGSMQLKVPQLLMNIHLKAHRFFTAFFCRSSSMLTVRSTAVLMARLIITQVKAPASSLVRQSW